MQVRLADQSLTGDLAAYLRRCECSVVPRGRGIIDVELAKRVSESAVVALVRSGGCCSCGQEIEPVLLELGSNRCHECRNGSGRLGVPLAQRWARMEIEAYVRIWDALHPGANPVCVDWA
jgi:hypothetical protein